MGVGSHTHRPFRETAPAASARARMPLPGWKGPRIRCASRQVATPPRTGRSKDSRGSDPLLHSGSAEGAGDGRSADIRAPDRRRPVVA